MPVNFRKAHDNSVSQQEFLKFEFCLNLIIIKLVLAWTPGRLPPFVLDSGG